MPQMISQTYNPWDTVGFRKQSENVKVRTIIRLQGNIYQFKYIPKTFPLLSLHEAYLKNTHGDGELCKLYFQLTVASVKFEGRLLWNFAGCSNLI
jgi:hypothetical protein